MADNAAKNCQGEKAGRLHSDVPLKYASWFLLASLFWCVVRCVCRVSGFGLRFVSVSVNRVQSRPGSLYHWFGVSSVVSVVSVVSGSVSFLSQ